MNRLATHAVRSVCFTAVVSSMAAAEVPRKPVYTRDVAPIFNANCVSCHRPGEIAPMSLLSYEEARPWAKSIAKNVGGGAMPPWHADAEFGSFSNDRSLSPDEIETIVRWAEKGAPRGKLEDMPPVPEFELSEWRLGDPDLVVTFDSVDLPGGGPDEFYDLEAPLALEHDRWIEAVEVLPSNRRVAHHVILYQDTGEGPVGGWLGAWAAGTDPMAFREGTGRLLKKDATLVADMHYHPAEMPQTDQTRVGFHFANDADIDKEVINLWIANQSIEIPAGAPNFKARASFTFPQDSHILSLLPHMHYRGTSFSYTARYPDGRKETLLRVSDYDFGWQTQYRLEEPIAVPKGTRIDCVAEWDNSVDNPRNPDATKTVRFGDESFDEMMIGFVDYIVDDGIRPEGPEAAMERLAVEMAETHGAEIYKADVSVMAENETVGQFFPGLVYLPRAGGSGVWHLYIFGSQNECPITNLVWTGDSFAGVVTIPAIGPVEFLGQVDPSTGVLSGAVLDPDDDDGVLISGELLD